MYVLSFDAPSIYKMSTEAPGAERAPARAAAGSGPGAKLYAQNCSACHGADREGMGGAIPSLEGVVQRLGAQTVLETVAGGRGQMPAFGGNSQRFSADRNRLLPGQSRMLASGEQDVAAPRR